MSAIKRYQKKGGFRTLVELLESCDTSKRQHLLSLIEQEDPRWASLAAQKLLTVKRILTWDLDSLHKILTPMTDNVLSIVLRQGDKKDGLLYLKSLPIGRAKVIINDINKNSPSAQEKAAANRLVVSKVRTLEKDEEINLKSIDPKMILDDPVPETELEPCILVVDPSDLARDEVSAELYRYNMLEAKDGHEAMELIKNTVDKRIIGVISEAELPEVDGLEFLMNLREHQKYQKLPFFILAENLDEQISLTAQQLNVTDCFSKPLNEKIKQQIVNRLSK